MCRLESKTSIKKHRISLKRVMSVNQIYAVSWESPLYEVQPVISEVRMMLRGWKLAQQKRPHHQLGWPLGSHGGASSIFQWEELWVITELESWTSGNYDASTPIFIYILIHIHMMYMLIICLNVNICTARPGVLTDMIIRATVSWRGAEQTVC